MRTAAVALLITLLGVFASETALARKGGGHHGGGKHHGSASHRHFSGHHHRHGHHGHHHHHKSVSFIGVGFGFAYPWYWYYPPPSYPAYSYPQPVTYIEQNPAPAAEPAGWWYYCESARAYYPYVKECPSGWQRVPALPPPPN